MARRVAWSPEAIEDLEAIAEFIGRDSRFYAQAVVSKALAIEARLADFPDAGRAVPEMCDAAIRERFVYSYHVIYRGELLLGKVRKSTFGVIPAKAGIQRIDDSLKKCISWAPAFTGATFFCSGPLGNAVIHGKRLLELNDRITEK